MAGVFARRGVDAWVFRGDDGLDELTTTTTSSVWVVTGGEVTEHTLDPASLGIPQGTAEGLRGQDAAYNAEVVRRLLAGETGPVRDAVLLNAGAALAVHAAEAGSIEEQLAPASPGRPRPSTPAPPRRPSSAGSPRPADVSEVEDPGARWSLVALEAEPPVVGADHPGRR